MEIDIKHACSFTGHRPERLEMSEDKVIAWLEEQIRKAVSDGYTDFITGMQRGVDIWAGEIVLKLRKEGLPVKLTFPKSLLTNDCEILLFNIFNAPNDTKLRKKL